MIEVMLAFLALSGGLVAIINFHSASQNATSEAKTRAEAVAFAEDKLQELESYLSQSDARMNDGTASDNPVGTNTAFTRAWTVATDGSLASQKNLTVSVAWLDRAGDAQSVQIGSELYFEEPTAPVASLLSVVSQAKLIASVENAWGTVGGGGGVGGGGDEGGGDQGGDQGGGDQGGDGGDGGQQGGGTPPATYRIVVTSPFSKANGTQFNGTTVSGYNYPVTCDTTSNSWTCTADEVEVGDSLTFSVTFYTNKVVCTPGPASGSGTYHFSGLNMDISSGYPVVIDKRMSDC